MWDEKTILMRSSAIVGANVNYPRSNVELNTKWYYIKFSQLSIHILVIFYFSNPIRLLAIEYITWVLSIYIPMLLSGKSIKFLCMHDTLNDHILQTIILKWDKQSVKKKGAKQVFRSNMEPMMNMIFFVIIESFQHFIVFWHDQIC